jgi:hypothetical protein
MIGASLLRRPPQHELKPDQAREQKSDVAESIDRLGQEFGIRAALAIKEDMLAKTHGPVSLAGPAL